MQDPEAHIDQSSLLNYQSERQWLRTYSEQLTNFPINPSVHEVDLLSKSDELAEVLKNGDEFGGLLNAIEEKEQLKQLVEEKQRKIEELVVKSINLEVESESKKQLMDKEMQELRNRVKEQEEAAAVFEAKIKDLQSHEKEEKSIQEISNLTTKIELMKTEFKYIELSLADKEKNIEHLKGQLLLVESEKLKALHLLSEKEERIKEQIESTYAFVDMQEQIKFYSKKMKEYQSLYLEQKALEDKVLQVLSHNSELESSLETTKNDLNQVSQAYNHLKQDYDLVSIQYRSQQNLNSSISSELSQLLAKSKSLESENSCLQSQLAGILDATSSGLLTFRTTEELIVQNSQINAQNSNLKASVQDLKEANLELSRRLEALEKGKVDKKVANDSKDENVDKFKAQEEYISLLIRNNSELVAENLYFMEKIKLAQEKEVELEKSIEELQEIVQVLENGFEKPHDWDSGSGVNERNQDKIQELGEVIKGRDEVIENLKRMLRKYKDEAEGADFACKGLESIAVGQMNEWKAGQDQLLSRIQELEEENLRLKRTCKEIESKNEGKVEAFVFEMEILRKRNEKLQEDLEGQKTQVVMNELASEEEVCRLKRMIEEEKNKNSVNEDFLKKMEKFTYLVYKALKRPNDVEDAKE